MKNIWSKYKFIITVAVYAVLVVVFMYYAVRPLVSGIRLRAYQAQSKSIDREIEKAQIERLPEIKKEWSDYESRQSVMNVILSQPDQVNFIESIETMAQTSGNKITLKIEDGSKNISFAAKSKEIMSKVAYPDYFPIEINLEGDYDGLVNFMHMLENNQFYVDVIAVSSKKNTLGDRIDNRNPFGNVVSSDAANTDKPADDSIKTDITAIVYTQKQ
ncbi:MAG: hypothetical protein WC022_03115 [Parcubacteria group bacterium]